MLQMVAFGYRPFPKVTVGRFKFHQW